MKKKRIKGFGTDIVHLRIRFQCKDLRLIENAADRRGIGRQDFIRLVSNAAAAKVMAQPQDEILGQIFGTTNTSSAPANAG